MCRSPQRPPGYAPVYPIILPYSRKTCKAYHEPNKALVSSSTCTHIKLWTDFLFRSLDNLRTESCIMSGDRLSRKDIAKGKLKERGRSTSRSSQARVLDERLGADSAIEQADLAAERQPRSFSGRSSQEKHLEERLAADLAADQAERTAGRPRRSSSGRSSQERQLEERLAVDMAADRAAGVPYEWEPPWNLPFKRKPNAEIVRKPVPGEQRVRSDGDAPQNSDAVERKRPLPARYNANRPMSSPVTRPVISTVPKPMPSIQIPKRKPVPPRKDELQTPQTPEAQTPISSLQRSPARRLTNQDRPCLYEGGSGRPRSSTGAPPLPPRPHDPPEPETRVPFQGGDTPEPSMHLPSMENSIELNMANIQTVRRRPNLSAAMWRSDARPGSTHGSISNSDAVVSRRSSLYGSRSNIAAGDARPGSAQISLSDIVHGEGHLRDSVDVAWFDAGQGQTPSRRVDLRGGDPSHESTPNLSPEEQRTVNRATIMRLLARNSTSLASLTKDLCEMEQHMPPEDFEGVVAAERALRELQEHLQEKLALLND